MKPRIKNSDRSIILKEATKLAESIGRYSINFALVAKMLNLSRTVIYNHFNSLDHLKEEVLLNAIKTNNVILIAEALIFGHINKDSLSKESHENILRFFK
jgi:AcrR family transcriptional regulator